MNYKVFAGNSIGYKNILKSLNSQDYLLYEVLQNGIIGCVADGHSSNFFEYSDIGSKIACKCGVDTLKPLINKSKEEVEEELKKYIIQKEIELKWRKLVKNHYYSIKPVVFNVEYIKYSTTLICTLITDEYILFLKIGDGDIVINKNNEFNKVIKTTNNKFVDSLGRENSHINMMYHIEDTVKQDINSIMLFTDGYENCFIDEKSLYSSLQLTISKYNKNIFTKALLMKTYDRYLSKINKQNSKDDISIILIMS